LQGRGVYPADAGSIVREIFNEIGNQPAAEEITRISSGMMDVINKVVSLAEDIMTHEMTFMPA
tara:strand:- start:674 stop:862 length:189 start_codon:yes stop_codon:yes gene_type:complete